MCILLGKQPLLCQEFNGAVVSERCPPNTYQPMTFSSADMIYCQVKRSCSYSQLLSPILCGAFAFVFLLCDASAACDDATVSRLSVCPSLCP